MLVRRDKSLRHNVAYFFRKRIYTIIGGVLVMFCYIFVVWVATISVYDHDLTGELEPELEVDGTEDAEFLLQEPEEDEAEVARENKPMRCAINFFGLPRSFEAMVLSSANRNVIRRNARFGCDYFIHYYHREVEAQGRAGAGGRIDPDEVLLMQQKIKLAAKQAKSTPNRSPVVIFVKDTEEEFWKKRGKQVEKYRTTRAEDGNYLYYPWKAITYHYPESLDNIVKQWHSIQSVWEAMEDYTNQSNRPKYDRVAMMRLDVMYALPVDIFKLDKSTLDNENMFAVSPGFAKYPVNDRLFYGPYNAVKIWATERFERLEKHVVTYEPGWGMHSERFLESAIFSAIKEAGIPMAENPDICVLRVRSDLSVWMNDCITQSGTTRGMKRVARQKLVEQLIGRKCRKSILNRKIFQLHCPLR